MFVLISSSINLNMQNEPEKLKIHESKDNKDKTKYIERDRIMHQSPKSLIYTDDLRCVEFTVQMAQQIRPECSGLLFIDMTHICYLRV
mmetsp:Transcript_57270/g.91188  ORF Transcript_57270/g.91188 Transcript_57270/m.91188 type:complete len:88 (-) Transcript_57270:231-494(-)